MQVSVPVQEESVESRRARGLARLAELGDEPGGEEFLARLGDLGDLTVDFVFGDVHARPGLGVRERELVIVAVLTALGGLDPQVRAHIRAAREAGVSEEELEETMIQVAPYAARGPTRAAPRRLVAR